MEVLELGLGDALCALAEPALERGAADADGRGEL